MDVLNMKRNDTATPGGIRRRSAFPGLRTFFFRAFLFSAQWGALFQCVAAANAGEASGASPAPAMRQDANCRQTVAVCRVNGTPLLMMLDTGASHTVLHTGSAAKLRGAAKVDTSAMQIRGNAQQQPELLLVDIEAGGSSFPRSLVLALDLRGVRSMMHEKIDGILGMDILSRLSFTINQQQGSCWGTPSTVGQAKPIPMQGYRDAFGRLVATVHCQGKPVEALLDTGCTVSQFPAAAWPTEASKSHAVRVGDVNAARTVSKPMAKRGDLELAQGAAQKDLQPSICAEGEPALLGMDALHDFALIHTPAGGFRLLPATPFATDTQP